MSRVRRYVVSRAEWAKQRRLFAFTRLSDGLDQLEEQARAPVWTSLGPRSEPHQATRRCVHGQTAFLHVKAILTDVPIGHCQHQSRPNQSTDPTSSSPKEASFCCLAWASAQRAARMTALLSSRIYKKKCMFVLWTSDAVSVCALLHCRRPVRQCVRPTASPLCTPNGNLESLSTSDAVFSFHSITKPAVRSEWRSLPLASKHRALACPQLTLGPDVVPFEELSRQRSASILT